MPDVAVDKKAMNQRENIQLLLSSLLGERDVIAYRPALARAFGSINVALFLCQAAYWQGKVGAGKWWFKLRDAERDSASNMIPPSSPTRQSWEWELGMTRSEQEEARRALRQHGLIEERRAGIPARLHYRVNLAKLEEFLIANRKREEFHRQDGGMVPSSCPNSSELQEEIGPAISQTKAEIKADKTTTTEHSSAESCSVQFDALIFEPAISQYAQKLTVILAQENLTGQQAAQNLLDELAASVEASSRGEREKIANPVAWLRGAIRKYQQGKFDPVRCAVVQTRREAMAHQAERTAVFDNIPYTPPEVARKRIGEIFAVLASNKQRRNSHD